jgi:excisionase family DNA binding protein
MPLTALEQLAESRGRTLDEAISWTTDVLARSAPVSRDPVRDWSNAEAAVLDEENIDVSGLGSEERDPAADSARRYLGMLADGLSVAQAAQQMGVNRSRVRQLLGERRIYGIRPGARAWVLPAWQFSGHGLLPGIDKVVAELDPALHPLVVTGFFTSAHPELSVHGHQLTPLEWLSGGGDPAEVTVLLDGLAGP